VRGDVGLQHVLPAGHELPSGGDGSPQCRRDRPALTSDEGESPLFGGPVESWNGSGEGSLRLSTHVFLQQRRRPPIRSRGGFVACQRRLTPWHPSQPLTGQHSVLTSAAHERRWRRRPIPPPRLLDPGPRRNTRFESLSPNPRYHPCPNLRNTPTPAQQTPPIPGTTGPTGFVSSRARFLDRAIIRGRVGPRGETLPFAIHFRSPAVKGET